MIEAELKALNFVRWGKIERTSKDQLCFTYERRRPADRREGFVYAWVRTDAKGIAQEICYVGKAGGTLVARASQHRGGFAGTGRGGALATLIRPILSQEEELVVWTRYSKEEELFGQWVSRCEVEEQALIGRLRPTWNAQLPRRRQRAASV